MKKIYTSQDPLIVSHFRNILESYNIGCVIKNEFLNGAAGELPPTECWPELWVSDTTQYDEALEILEKIWVAENVKPPSWACSYCGEEVEGQFTECWQCGKSRYK